MSEQLVLPFYVLADVSYSMTQSRDGVTPLQTLNDLVPHIKDALDENPMLGDKVRFSLVDFADEAHVQIPLCDLLKVDASAIPTLEARGGTSFAAAFRATRTQLDSDVRQLKADGHKVHRPVVFFLTDGEPTDADGEWQAAWAELTDASFVARPNIIPFGIDQARKEVLDQIVYPAGKMRSFVAADGTKPSDAIRSMAEVLIGSIVASASSVADNGSAGRFVLEDPDEDDTWI